MGPSIRRQRFRSALGSTLLWGALGLAAPGCASADKPADTAATGPNLPLPSASVIVSASVGAPSAAPLPSAQPPGSASSLPVAHADRPAPTTDADPVGPLATFHRALLALKSGTRKSHVRVLWLGDSHAQADFWTDHIRVGLQQRFGHGGPGFMRIGYRSYRHASAAVKVDGSWRMRPKRPSTITPWGDGAFGLGGILHAGYAGYRRARLTLADDKLAGRKWRAELCYKFGLVNDHFEYQVGAQPPSVLKPEDKRSMGQIRYVQASGTGLAAIQVVVKAGRPDFCGVTVETDPSDGAGVVLDNIGINGARYATALAWNEQAWAAAVKRRPAPELFIFEFGGNEASDMVIEPARYEKNALALIARSRAIRGDVSCLVVGPSDRADAEAKIPPIVAAVKAAALASGCGFWDTYEKMGGRGSIARWQPDGRASQDGVHLKPKGYEVLGKWLLRDLLKDLDP